MIIKLLIFISFFCLYFCKEPRQNIQNANQNKTRSITNISKQNLSVKKNYGNLISISRPKNIIYLYAVRNRILESNELNLTGPTLAKATGRILGTPGSRRVASSALHTTSSLRALSRAQTPTSTFKPGFSRPHFNQTGQTRTFLNLSSISDFFDKSKKVDVVGPITVKKESLPDVEKIIRDTEAEDLAKFKIIQEDNAKIFGPIEFPEKFNSANGAIEWTSTGKKWNDIEPNEANLLGRGSFGTAYKLKDSDGNDIVQKIYHKEKIDDPNAKALILEEISSLQHWGESGVTAKVFGYKMHADGIIELRREFANIDSLQQPMSNRQVIDHIETQQVLTDQRFIDLDPAPENLGLVMKNGEERVLLIDPNLHKFSETEAPKYLRAKAGEEVLPPEIRSSDVTSYDLDKLNNFNTAKSIMESFAGKRMENDWYARFSAPPNKDPQIHAKNQRKLLDDFFGGQVSETARARFINLDDELKDVLARSLARDPSKRATLGELKTAFERLN